MPVDLSRLRYRLILAAVAGAMAALGHAPFGLWPLAIAGFAGVFALLRGTREIRASAWTGWAAGCGYFALALVWIVEPFLIQPERDGWMAPFAIAGLSAGLARFWAGAAAASRALGGGAVAWVGTLAAVELARSYVLTGFPWALIGHVWIDTPVMQVAALAGPLGLTVLALALAAAAVLLWEPAHRWGGLAAVAVVGIAAIWGVSVTGGRDTGGVQAAQAAADRPVIRMVQPNAAQHLKWDRDLIPAFFQRQIDYTAAPGLEDGTRPDLVIWSETAVTMLLEDAEPALELIAQAADGVPVLLGIQRFIGQRIYNSALLLNAEGAPAAIYDKYHLVPFGEYMPFGDQLARFGIHGMAASAGRGFSPGPGARLMDLGGALGRALPLICYEAVFPQDIAAAPERPDFLLQITNDAWFGELSGPYQHLAQARLRAVEQGLPMVRVANTGVSAMIDPLGRVTAEIPLGQAGWLDAALPEALPSTLYARTGDLPMAVFLLGLLALITVRKWRQLRHE